MFNFLQIFKRIILNLSLTKKFDKNNGISRDDIALFN